MVTVRLGAFEWDDQKDNANQEKHGVAFSEAMRAFMDPHRIIAIDELHSKNEERFYCIGKAEDKIITVRFTYRRKIIRIFGAGFWRKGKGLYEKQNRCEKENHRR